jgi:hypothetical protein
MKKSALLALVVRLILSSCSNGNEVVWQIGENNDSGSEFALAPNGYKEYVANDFGWEDKFFLIGTSDIKKDWPYIIPGTGDTWGGTWGTSGWRSSTLNILFGVDKLPNGGDWKLTIDFLDCNSRDLPLFKVSINGKSWKYRIPVINSNNGIDDEIAESSEYLLEIPVPGDVRLVENNQVYVRSVKAADYEIEEANAQPLLVDVQHLKNLPELKVTLDGEEIFAETVEAGRYTFEAPMPAVESSVKSEYEILIDGTTLQSGKVVRGPKDAITPAGYVDTKIGTAHSRWMIAPGN